MSVSPAVGYCGFGHCSELPDEMIDFYLLGYVYNIYSMHIYVYICIHIHIYVYMLIS